MLPSPRQEIVSASLADANRRHTITRRFGTSGGGRRNRGTKKGLQILPTNLLVLHHIGEHFFDSRDLGRRTE